MLGRFGSLLWRKKKTLGQTVAEYALIVALVAIASIAVIGIFGNQLRDLYAVMVDRLTGDTSTSQTDYGDDAHDAVDRGLGNL
jgi:Flp pilus assembly pilin Flp